MFKILATIALLNTTNAQITADNTWAKEGCDDAIEIFKCNVLKAAQDDPTTVHECEAEYGAAGTKAGEAVTVAAAAATAEDGQANDAYFTFAEY
jgi:hypothetical protein